ncbi:serine/threonine-protein kinase [Actinomadura flavalba]|uniref:serine/threonine-protein kinase n=1 Tax=Actinomadura flavalba TaxID=1120938 RepID=UPI0012DE98C0|nr:serine/threonine-protein kinase [Actinomadura flavalba]
MGSRADGAETQLVPGTVVGQRFHVGRQVGQGGMGTAYKARDLETDKDVVVKIPQLSAMSDFESAVRERVRKRFTREAKLLRKLHHPNIPAVIDEGAHGAVRYIVMTYIEGRELSEFRRSKPPSLLEFAAIGTSVGRALAACHREEILHRDLKPDNLMIGDNGVVYVIDFGIALPLGKEATRYTENWVGTDAYMAPERFSNGDQPEQSDLYSLGCVFYFMIVGRPPFEGDWEQIKRQHLEDPPVPPSRLVNRVPRRLEELTLALLAKRIEDRPNLDETLAVLKRYLPAKGDPEPNPVRRPDVTVPYRAPATVRRPEAAAASRAQTSQPFVPRQRSGLLTTAEISETLHRASTEQARGDTTTAARTLHELHDRAIESFGPNSPKLLPIKSALHLLDGP